jgi:hypothetical protein
MNAQQVWLAQATEAPRISLEYIRHQASSLERGTRRRTTFNDILFVLAGALVVGFVWAAPNVYLARPLMAAAVVYYLLFLIYCTYRLHRHTAAQANTAGRRRARHAAFHRRQLERQRDFRRGCVALDRLGNAAGSGHAGGIDDHRFAAVDWYCIPGRQLCAGGGRPVHHG